MWTEGVIDIEAKAIRAVLFLAKVYDEPSSSGICDGRISKLRLKIDSKVVCDYDRSWDIRPTCFAAEAALKELLNRYDGRSLDAEIIYED